MKHPDPWRNTSPRGRTDPTHPPQSPRDSAGTVVSRPGRRHPAAAPEQALASGGPTPATVWVPRRSPSDLDAGWPLPVVENIVTSFTAPGAHVVLLPWPTPVPITPGILDRELQDALTTVRGLDRTAQVIQTEPAPRTGEWSIFAPDRSEGMAVGADLVLTSLRPEHSGDRASDQVTWAAARLLRTGGILTVLTHSDWSHGQLIDPTGAVVAAAQNADLLYLQHIIVVHAPVRDGEFMIEPETTNPDDTPATHHRIHTDLLAFAQPHDHHPHQAEPLR